MTRAQTLEAAATQRRNAEAAWKASFSDALPNGDPTLAAAWQATAKPFTTALQAACDEAMLAAQAQFADDLSPEALAAGEAAAAEIGRPYRQLVAW